MTREEQLQFCKKCINRVMDMKQGLVCSISGQKAAFENQCADFKLDDSVVIAPVNDADRLVQSEIAMQLSTEEYERLRLDQNLPWAVAAGIAIDFLGAVLWGIITVASQFQIGVIALAIGA